GEKLPVVGMEIPACRLDGLVAEDLLQHVQRDTSIGHPCRAGVSESVTGEAWLAELGDDVVPVRRVTHCRCREDAAAGSDDETCIRRSVFREPFEDGNQWREDWDRRLSRPLVCLVTRPPAAGMVWRRIVTRLASQSTSPTSSPA